MNDTYPAPCSSSANSPEKWNETWSKETEASWRECVLAPVYERISELMPHGVLVVDIGGGVGTLAAKLRDDNRCDVTVWEHNESALNACRAKGLEAKFNDLEYVPEIAFRISTPECSYVATEVLEHLSDAALSRLMTRIATSEQPCFFSVPNDRLGPDEEPEHARSWTAKTFLDYLHTYFEHARVEVLGPKWLNPGFKSTRGQPSFLLGIVNMPKATKLSVCWPARDEAADMEKCLASYRGVADELVIGIDPRTKDNTRELAEKYADVVFELTELRGPPDDQTPEGGFHFAHARNQCMNRCTSPWIFMTEAHEPLVEGKDALLHLEQIPDAATVVNVVRQGGRPPHREQWLFPWLCRNRPDIRYARSTHNTLVYPDDVMVVTLPQVKTLHERVHAAALARKNQRAVQNRVKLMDDWVTTGNTWSLQYLGSEWRDHSPEKAVHYLREYLDVGKFGTLRYNTRLILARTLAELGRLDEAAEILHGGTADDWARIEHFIYLGDIVFETEQYEQARSFYEYAATRRGRAPLITLWVDLAFYSWIPAQRLAQTCAELGDLPAALHWAQEVLADFQKFGDDAPKALVDEAETNIRLIEEAIHGKERSIAAD